MYKSTLSSLDVYTYICHVSFFSPDGTHVHHFENYLAKTLPWCVSYELVSKVHLTTFFYLNNILGAQAPTRGITAAHQTILGEFS